VAQSFTAGGVSQALGSVTLSLKNIAGVDETVTVHLFSNTTDPISHLDVPGSSLLTIGSVTVPANSGFADHTLSAPSAFTLQANTTYWLEAESGGPLAVDWAVTFSTTTTGPGTLGSWANAADPSVRWFPVPSGPLQLEVDSPEVAAVPEPSGLALLGLGGAGLLGWRVRRRRAAA
jgi:hypothetical protein